ncbi:stalk domain-containing protein [Ructibacterium gallinarum]|uniref:Copper amine oxidase-like N-terminal domain-containing protein n=1 Tax=Ructibacterium gallinarum TaxID=2779355 RepID=A0A9D5M514_9FIRM|nr:stalk domain-containing protein [Ructibacterium gallinarum]MBE5040829.1 hypothetical protein [Ructibacterium gallinarum]
MNRKIVAFILGGAMLCSMSFPVMAEEIENMPNAAEDTVQAPDSVLYYGKIMKMKRDDTEAIQQIRLNSERYGEYIMNVSEETVWIDSENVTAFNPADLKENERVYVFHSPAVTASLPPQSAAIAVVRNIPQDAGCAMYHVVDKVTQAEDGSLQILTDNGGLILSADEKTDVVSYLTKNIVTLEDIQEGTRIMAWYSAVAESYPGQAYANHIMILPNIEEEEEVLQEGQQITMELDGKVPNMTGRYENGTVMVPVAAVARDLGFEAKYTVDEDGELVTVESDSFSVHLRIGQDMIFGVTKIEGAVGMTAPQNYGKAPYIVDPGVTWAPAELFTMLGKTVTLEDSNLVIE